MRTYMHTKSEPDRYLPKRSALFFASVALSCVYFQTPGLANEAFEVIFATRLLNVKLQTKVIC